MTKEQAFRIFEEWKSSIEMLDKIIKVFTTVPESFLPYSAETLDEALNIVAKDFHDQGDYKTSKNIREVMAGHLADLYMKSKEGVGIKATDEEVLLDMKWKLDGIFGDPKLKEAILANLRKSRESWAEKKGMW